MANTTASLLKKLGIRPGQAVCFLGAKAAAISELIRKERPDVKLLDALDGRRCDVIFYWPKPADDLPALFAELQRHIVPDGAVWAVVRTKTGRTSKGPRVEWSAVQAAALTTDLVDNKVVSLSGDEYATRFVIRKSKRGQSD